jgi:hypothetical protein
MQPVLSSEVPRVMLLSYISLLDEHGIDHPAMSGLLSLQDAILSNRAIDYESFVCPDPLLTVLLSMNEFFSEPEVNIAVTKRFRRMEIISPCPVQRSESLRRPPENGTPRPVLRDEPYPPQRGRSDSVRSFPSYSSIPLYPYSSDSSSSDYGILRPESLDSEDSRPRTPISSNDGTPLSSP